MPSDGPKRNKNECEFGEPSQETLAAIRQLEAGEGERFESTDALFDWMN